MVDEWPELPLAECMAAIIDYRGKTPRKTTSGIPLVTAKIIKGGRIEQPSEYINPADYDEWMRRGIPAAGDIVLTTEAPLGEVAQLDERKVALAQRVITLRGREGFMDNTFLKFLMQSSYVQEQLKGRSTGTTVHGIRQSELRKVLLLVPPIGEQRAIALILGTLDNKIELNRKMKQTLEAMARDIFKSWFVDFDPVRAKAEGRDPGLSPDLAALFPDSFEDSELGEIPKGWNTSSVYDLATYINGAAYRAFEPNEEGRGLPIIKIMELKAGVTSQTRFSSVDMPSKYKIDTGDILFSWSRNPDTSIDIFVWPHGPAWLNQHIFRIVPHSVHERAFILMTLRSFLPVFAEIARNKQTTGLGHVTVEDLKRLVTVRPPESVSQGWNMLVEPILARSLDLQIESKSLVAMRDALLPKLLSGEIRVKTTAKAAESIR